MKDSGAIEARHDYLPFGEEIQSDAALRTAARYYDTVDSTRQRYAGMERDASGLDHTLWRKYESKGGRWTSPDPYSGSMSVGDPQSFNRYAYVGNDPVNRADPSGLYYLVDGVSSGVGGFHYGPDGVYGGYFGDLNILILRGGIGKEGHRRLEIYGDIAYFLGQNPDINDLRRRITEMTSKLKCKNFIRDLINNTATPKNPAEGTDALALFNRVVSQNGVVFGDSIKKLYGFSGATTHGALRLNSAQIELPTPAPFPVGLSRQGAAEYREDQGRLDALAALHETLHLSGKNGYSDFAFAAAVASMRGVAPPNYSNLSNADAVNAASKYWNSALEAACDPKKNR